MLYIPVLIYGGPRQYFALGLFKEPKWLFFILCEVSVATTALQINVDLTMSS